jgi:3-deoxy-D-manno-octulosonic acid (KDO) 8-phosphate synthase
MSDGPNSWPLKLMKPLLEQLKALDDVAKSRPFLEDSLDSE